MSLAAGGRSALRRLGGRARCFSSAGAIFRGSVANKHGLSALLDGTLKGNHDMKSFGLGFVRSCSSREAYAKFTTSHYHFYSAMEQAFDAQPEGSAMHGVWAAVPELHGAPAKLEVDLAEVGVDAASTAASPAAAAYVQAVEAASNSNDGVELIGHFYCRYFADLFGGSMLGTPTRLSLGLKSSSPAFYRFGPTVEDHRADFIEHVYE